MGPDPTGSRAGSPRRRSRGVPSARTSALVLGILISVLAAGCSPAKLVESAALLADFNAGEGPSRLKQATPAPRRLLTTYEVEGRQRRGDLYLPGEDALANLVLVPGVTPEGKDDPRLVAFATTLARARFVVLVPDIENLREIKVGSSDARDIGDAVLHLAGAGLAGASTAVGVVAVSYAVGPAVLAALAEDTRERVRFLVAIGGYYDLQSMITFFTTGYYRDAPGRPWRPLRANAYGKWVFVKSNADRLRDPSDRAALTEMADRKLRDLAADIGDLAAALGPEGRSVYALLNNRSPDRVPEMIAALPAAIREEIEALNLERRSLADLPARVILLHGRDDTIIPFGESRALAAALPEERVDLYLVDSMSHVDLGPAGLDDTFTFWRAIYRLLEERDRAARAQHPSS